MEPLNADKLANADLRVFARSADGTRTVLVELNLPGPRVAPPMVHLPGRRRAAVLHRAQEPEPDDVEERMAALEQDLKALHAPSKPTRLNLARAFAITVTPSHLRALTRLRHVGIVRPSQSVQPAG